MTPTSNRNTVVHVAWGVIPYKGAWGVFKFDHLEPTSTHDTKAQAITFATSRFDKNEINYLRVYNDDASDFKDSFKTPAGQRPDREGEAEFLRYFRETEFRVLREQAGHDHA